MTVFLVFDNARLKLLSNKLCKKSISLIVTSLDRIFLNCTSFNSILAGSCSRGNKLLYYLRFLSASSFLSTNYLVSMINLCAITRTSMPNISLRISPASSTIMNYTMQSQPCGQLDMLIRIDFNLGNSSSSFFLLIARSHRYCKILLWVRYFLHSGSFVQSMTSEHYSSNVQSDMQFEH